MPLEDPEIDYKIEEFFERTALEVIEEVLGSKEFFDLLKELLIAKYPGIYAVQADSKSMVR